LRQHLMRVGYDRETFNSQAVPGKVNGQDVHAEPGGPVSGLQPWFPERVPGELSYCRMTGRARGG